VYALYQVDDDLNWNADDAHLSAANAVQWAIEAGSGEGMGATDEDHETSLGMVDIWHWELGCDTGQESGGAVSGPGDGNDPGNDDACNFDDEYATSPEDRDDDNLTGAENSLLGVWTHSASAEDDSGTWTFEMKRPLQTGDEGDAQFEAGSSARVALAYWDADSGPEGWDDDYHVQSGNQGWITVQFE
jgi:Ethylbenzene dehydrogenase